MITSIFPVVCADDVAATRDFYVDQLGFRSIFDVGWYVQLEAPSGARPQLGIVDREHESVPERFRLRPAGVLVSIEVDDVDAVHDRIAAAGHEIAFSLRSEDFGQRHFMTLDPSGTLVDVITPIPPSPEYAAAYGLTAEGTS
ncbi:VOC family protein [Kribbella sp. CA-247076]|uniref:VOC family protein n=1 Tax=Kribbella sp. CA-247076 TaxID=3239941 RepID=UPI003D8A696C